MAFYVDSRSVLNSHRGPSVHYVQCTTVHYVQLDTILYSTTVHYSKMQNSRVEYITTHGIGSFLGDLTLLLPKNMYKRRFT